jgi:hypothetical protein
LQSDVMTDLGHRLRSNRNALSQIEKHVNACEKAKRGVLKHRAHETDSDDKTDEVLTRLL